MRKRAQFQRLCGRLLFSSMAVLVASLVGATVSPPLAKAAISSLDESSNWTQYGYGPDHSGYNPTETELNGQNVNGLHLLWTVPTGGFIYSDPIESGGMVYEASSDGFLYCLTAPTGAVQWKTSVGTVADSDPAINNGVVFVSTLYNGVYAVDAATGAVLWNARLGDTSGGSISVSSSGTVFVTRDLDDGPILYALSPNSGAIDWQSFLSGQDTAAPQSSPAVLNGDVYVGWTDQVYAFDESTGDSLWTATIPNAFFESSPAVDGSDVLVASVGKKAGLFEFNSNSGTEVWVQPGTGQSSASPSFHGALAYVSNISGHLFAIRVANGKVVWTLHDRTGDNVAIVNGLLVVAAVSGRNFSHLLVFEARTGKELWSSSPATLTRASSSPIVANGEIFVAARKNIYAFGPSS